jgi:signal transduction histidine kinase
MATNRPPSISRTDVWIAVLAGEGAWGNGERPDPAMRLAAQIQLTGLIAVVTMMWTLAPERFGSSASPSLPIVATIVTTLAIALVIPRPALLAVGRRRRLRHPIASASFRLMASAVMFLGIVIVLPGWRALAVWPLGVAGGADGILTRWALGLSFDGRQFWGGLLRSPVMAGVVAALTIVVLRGGLSWDTLATAMVFGGFTLALMAAWVTMWLLDTIRRELDQRESDAVRRARREEHRRRAHWLHDDVCAELQLTSLRLRTGQVTPDQVAGELADLDHRLRVRQTDELIASGDARLAELVQPALRRVQAAGVRLVDVPTLDDAQIRLHVQEARMFTRILGVLVSNAVNAGAAHLSVQLTHDDDRIAVTVTDDAGGFPDTPLPPGRGLERLVRELGPGALDIERTADGSRVRLSMPYSVVHRRSTPSPMVVN